MLETVSKSEILTDEFRAWYENLGLEARTERGLLNEAYKWRAHAVLYCVPGCSWLCDAEKMRMGEKDAYKPTILIELGKIKDTEAMIAIALQICDIKPKSKQGALMVKQARLGKQPGDTVDLANRLIKFINSYCMKYELKPDDILDALQTAYSQTLKLKSEEQEDADES